MAEIISFPLKVISLTNDDLRTMFSSRRQEILTGGAYRPDFTDFRLSNNEIEMADVIQYNSSGRYASILKDRTGCVQKYIDLTPERESFLSSFQGGLLYKIEWDCFGQKEWGIVKPLCTGLFSLFKLMSFSKVPWGLSLFKDVDQNNSFSCTPFTLEYDIYIRSYLMRNTLRPTYASVSKLVIEDMPLYMENATPEFGDILKRN